MESILCKLHAYLHAVLYNNTHIWVCIYKTNIQKHLRIINKYLVIFTCISKLIELNYWNLKTLTLITHNVCACIWIFSVKQTSIKFPRYRSNWTNQKIDCSSNKTTKKNDDFFTIGQLFSNIVMRDRSLPPFHGNFSSTYVTTNCKQFSSSMLQRSSGFFSTSSFYIYDLCELWIGRSFLNFLRRTARRTILNASYRIFPPPSSRVADR